MPGHLSSEVEQLTLHLLPALPNGDAQYLPLHNEAFRVWHEIWVHTLSELGTHGQLSVDAFLRQSLILCLEGRDATVAGLLCCTFYHLDSLATRMSPYFQTISPAAQQHLEEEGIRSCMSMEYLTVTEKWRGRHLGVPVSELLIGLGMQLVLDSGADGSVGTARRDTKIDSKSLQYGTYCLEENISRYNLICNLMIAIRGSIRPHQDPNVARLISLIWRNRQDWVSLSKPNPTIHLAKSA